MIINLWSKTLLTSYRYLNRISDAIDKLIKTNALNCYDISGAMYSLNNTLDVSNRIIDLSERKIKMINLKILIEKTLLKLKKDDAIILIHRYIENLKFKDVANVMKISMRTCFRKLDNAETSFTNILNSQNWREEKLENYLKDEHWILSIYNEYKNNKRYENMDFNFNIKTLVKLQV